MKAKAQSPIERIQKVSKQVRFLCTIGMGLTFVSSLVLVVMLISGNWGTIELGGADAKKPITIPFEQLTVTSRVSVSVLAVLAVAIILKGMYHFRKLFGHYADGNIFTIESVAQIRKLGIAYLLWAGLAFLSTPVAFALGLMKTPKISVIINPITLGNLLPFYGGNSEVFNTLVTACILILISWVMDVGRGLREEHDLTI